MNKDIEHIIEEKKWEKITKYSPDAIARSFSFKKALSIAYSILYNDKWDYDLQLFAVRLFNEIRNTYPEMWNASWEFDALLGLAYDITSQYDEKYEAYQRAYNKASAPPPGLLIELADCCICPGTPPISYDEAINLLLRALKEAPYADAIGLLSHIYSLKDDKQNKEYWSERLKNCDQSFVSPPIDPEFLMEEYLKNN